MTILGRDVTGRGDAPEPSEVINTLQAGPTSSEFRVSLASRPHWPHPRDTKASAPFNALSVIPSLP